MELPSDSEAEYDHEIYVSVWQEAVKNQYSAYCSYFDEEIFFESENIFEPNRARCVGGNVRGFYNLRPIKYQGKNALQASEYLYGMPVKEVVSYATASIYKYAESIGRGSEAFFIRDKDLLTTRYNPEQFFLFPDGIGLYYIIYAIADGASGDYVFIIPFPDKE